jgi:hypothetical protein
LIDVAAQWARERGLSSLTLTSYEQVPWNPPYYGRLGFEVVPETEQSPELRAGRRSEIARGLDAWPRVVMRRPGCHGRTAHSRARRSRRNAHRVHACGRH